MVGSTPTEWVSDVRPGVGSRNFRPTVFKRNKQKDYSKNFMRSISDLKQKCVSRQTDVRRRSWPRRKSENGFFFIPMSLETLPCFFYAKRVETRNGRAELGAEGGTLNRYQRGRASNVQPTLLSFLFFSFPVFLRSIWSHILHSFVDRVPACPACRCQCLPTNFR